MEMKMYAVGVSTDEAWAWICNRPDDFMKLLEKAGVKAVHPDPQGRFQAFLYLTPQQRNKAYHILRKELETVFVIAEPAFVPLDSVQG